MHPADKDREFYKQEVDFHNDLHQAYQDSGDVFYGHFKAAVGLDDDIVKIYRRFYFNLCFSSTILLCQVPEPCHLLCHIMKFPYLQFDHKLHYFQKVLKTCFSSLASIFV